MKFASKTIKEILLKGHYVTAEDIKKAEIFEKTYHLSFFEYLLAENLITQNLLGQAIAESFQVPYADLNAVPASLKQIQKIPEAIAKKLRVVFFFGRKR